MVGEGGTGKHCVFLGMGETSACVHVCFLHKGSAVWERRTEARSPQALVVAQEISPPFPLVSVCSDQRGCFVMDNPSTQP